MDITRQLQAEIKTLLDENRHLTDTINARTIELKNKTRDLEVEAALEKVRAAAISMQKSDELRVIVGTIYDQLRQLGFTYGACGIIIMDSITGDMNWWMAGFGKDDYPENYYIPFFDHPFYIEQLSHWKAGDPFVELHVTGDQKKSYDEIIFSKTDFARIPEDAKKIMSAFTKITFSMAYMKHGALSWGTDPINSEHANILQRFAVVFEQAYTRFLDLKKAESQAKEAQIELGLERVRAKAMAMRSSEELGYLIGTVYTELTRLDISLNRCFFMIFDNKANGVTWWMAGQEVLSLGQGFFVKYHEHPPYLAYLHAWEQRRERWQYLLGGNEKKAWDDFIFNETELANLPDFVIAGMRSVETAYISASFNNFGCLTTGTLEPLKEESFEILLRFAKVFDLTYTRFNDLKQSEAQTREAKIETALERIRSKTMGMQRSDELRQVVATMYEQLRFLDITFGACTIIIIDNDTGNMQHWVGGFGQKVYPESYQVPYFNHPFINTQLSQWRAGENYAVLELSGESKTSYDAYMFSQSEFKNFPEADKQWMQQIESVTFSIAYMKHGALTWGPAALSDEHQDVLRRFAKVFDQTYTRFLDLKLAEAHALQAEEDLIKLQIEKNRAEDALLELRATQAQLIQSEKMASLGELTAGIAHEIQNPLNFVNNFSEVSNELIDEMLTEVTNGNYEDVKIMADDIKQNLLKINQHGKRAEGIVKGMLQHSRISTGQKELTNINTLADEYLHLAYHGLRAKDKSFNATLQTDYEEAIENIMIIPQEIGRVILNLINNAFYAVNEKATIVNGSTGIAAVGIETANKFVPVVSISSGKLQNNIEVRVKDNGNGIPVKILDKIFQPFFTTKPTGKGTGLGLSMAYDIMKAHGGDLKVVTKEGAGTEFIIQLPVQQ